MTSKAEIYPKTLLVLLSVGVTLFVCEIGLRLLYGRQSEVLDYRDTWQTLERGAVFGPGGFLKKGFRGEVQDGFGRTVRWVNNSQGFRNDVEFAVPKPVGTFRILSLGDSFTGGYRVGQEDTFSALTEEFLAQRNPKTRVEVMVSVIEDPAYGLYYLQQYGLEYEPDLVILGITLGNDIQQTLARLLYELDFHRGRGRISRKGEESSSQSVTGTGLESMRLPPQCLTEEKPSRGSLPPPAVETYDRRRVQGLRMIQLLSDARDHLFLDQAQTVVSESGTYDEPLLWESHGLGLLLKDGPPEVLQAYDALFAVLDGFAKVTTAHGIRFMAVIFPQRYQVRASDWSETKRVYRLKGECFDLERPNRLIMEYCARTGINCLDPTNYLQSASAESLYLPRHDMHWNVKGHGVLTRFLAPKVESVMHSHQDDGR